MCALRGSGGWRQAGAVDLGLEGLGARTALLATVRNVQPVCVTAVTRSLFLWGGEHLCRSEFRLEVCVGVRLC